MHRLRPALLLVFAASAAAAQAVPLDPRAIDRAAQAQADGGFSGVVLVADRDSVIFRRSYGSGPSRPTWSSWVAHHLLDRIGDAR